MNMKKIFKRLSIIAISFAMSIVLNGCSDDDCGNCTGDLISQDITLDGATLRIFQGLPTIHTIVEMNGYKEEGYYYICNEKKAEKLIKKVKDGGYLRVNVKGKFRALREGEPDVSNYDPTSSTHTICCDIEILKIKKS